MSADTQRYNEQSYLILQLADGSIVQMIIMIMGEQNRIQLRQEGSLQRKLLAVAAAADERKRGWGHGPA